MFERGIDISGKRTKSLDRFAHTRFDRVITLCDRVKEICPEFPGAPITAHWSVPDPAADAPTDEDGYSMFVSCADDIESRVHLLIADVECHVEPTGRAHVAR